MKKEDIKQLVREGYARVAQQNVSCCGSSQSCCTGASLSEQISKNIGYSEEEIKAVPEGANLGLGCGNPIAMASLKDGEIVLDLGSGAGFDCFLAANKVGKEGKVIGIDMTPEMIEKARENAKKSNYTNVEFRLGEIEHLPVADNSVDIVISNCVINLSPDKTRVFAEAFRVLRPGGRVMISDIVLLKPLPEIILNTIEAYIGCIAGAIMKDEYVKAIQTVGFKEVKIIDETVFSLDCIISDPTAQVIINKISISPELVKEAAESVLSIKVCGLKSN